MTSADGRPDAVPTRQLENERVIVTEWRFAPGAHTGWHRHEYDYVVVPIATGDLEVESAAGTVRSSLALGVPYFREAGAEHNVKNGNDFEFAFVEIELKG